jgi:hypothetical protein
MNSSCLFAALLLALPLAATAQTTPSPTTPPAPGTQVSETTEDLDPATGKVIRRTTRTYTVPAATPVAGKTTTPAVMPTGAATAPAAPAASEPSDARATDVQVSAFLRKKTAVNTLTGPALLDAYSRFIDKVRSDRQSWKAADWTTASSVLSSLNARYEQLRPNMSFDDKLTIRTQQAEFHALRTGRQISDQVSDKL